jgi:hypothetical protein
MSEPLTTTGAGLGLKYIFIHFIIPTLMTLAGAIAHVLEEIRMDGWKGWVNALSSGFVAFFAGTVVFSFALHFYPDYAGGLAGLGGFFGAKSIGVLIKILKITVKEL